MSEEQTNEAEFLDKNPSMLKLIDEFSDKIHKLRSEIPCNQKEKKQTVKPILSEKIQENNSNPVIIAENNSNPVIIAHQLSHNQKQREKAIRNFVEKYVTSFATLELFPLDLLKILIFI